MSKSANAGELRTIVYFMRNKVTMNPNGVPIEKEENVMGEGVPVWCKWVNAHGSEVWDAMQLELRQPATITTRYSPELDDPTLLVYRNGDLKPYEVISVDNVEQRNAWLEIKIQRKAVGRDAAAANS